MTWIPRIPPFVDGVPKKSAFVRIHASFFLFSADRQSFVIASKTWSSSALDVGTAAGFGATLSLSGSEANQWKPDATCHASSPPVREIACGRHAHAGSGRAASALLVILA